MAYSSKISISIIIPIYNVEDYIEDCIKSVISQDFTNYEILLVDDCSPDSSINIAIQLLKMNASISYKLIRHKVNKGLSCTRNTGIKEAQGDYILFLDSDDTLPPNSLRNLFTHTNNAVDLVIGRVQTITFQSKIITPRFVNNYVDNKKKIISYYNKGIIYPIACNKLINRKFLEKNKLFFQESILHEDELWSFYIIMCVNTIAFCNDITYTYLIRSKSITTNPSVRNIKSIILILNKMIDYCDMYNISYINIKLNYILFLIFCMLPKINIDCNEHTIKNELRLLLKRIRKRKSIASIRAIELSILFSFPIYVIIKVIKLKQ